MNIIHKRSAPRYRRDDIVSYLLVSERTCGSEKLTVTLVEMAPGGVQRIHAHEPEQMYYILEGSGVMTVENEETTVQVGDCIFFPTFARHGLKNTGGTVLKYLSAASPSFGLEESHRLWPLPGIDET